MWHASPDYDGNKRKGTEGVPNGATLRRGRALTVGLGDASKREKNIVDSDQNDIDKIDSSG